MHFSSKPKFLTKKTQKEGGADTYSYEQAEASVKGLGGGCTSGVPAGGGGGGGSIGTTRAGGGNNGGVGRVTGVGKGGDDLGQNGIGC